MEKPESPLQENPSPSPGCALGIDLGGTKILAGVVSPDFKILGRAKLKTPFAGGTAALSRALCTAADEALLDAHVSRENIRTIGVGAPGVLDADRGVLVRAGNLAVRGFDIPKAFVAAFPGVPCRIENDVRLAGLAEARLGAGRGAASMVAIWVGTGIGGAVILDGKVRTGRNRSAGEIGQIQIDFRRAKPGEPDGTLEGIAAKVGITRYLLKKIEAGEKTELARVLRKKSRRLSGSDLAKAFSHGDRLTRRAVARSAKAVGIAISNVFNVFSPDLFVLGGGVAVDLGAPYFTAVKRWATRFAFTTELGSLEIAPAALGDDAGLLGAALHSWDSPTR